MSEDKVFEQEISPEELENAAGGGLLHNKKSAPVYGCQINQRRDIYEGGFPNCAATVEDGSFCNSNDACFKSAVNYTSMQSCFKAWQ